MPSLVAVLRRGPVSGTLGVSLGRSTVRIVVPDPTYTLVNCERDGLPEVVSVNSALLSFPHNDIFPWHLRITLFARHMIENGMPAPEESELLFEIGDTIETAVLDVKTAHGGRNALFLARSTWNKLRELYYRVHDPELIDLTLKDLLKSRAWQRDWQYEMSHDVTWEKAGFVLQVLAPDKRC